MEWATLVWMGGMTVIAVAVERRTSRLEKKLDERQNITRDAGIQDREEHVPRDRPGAARLAAEEGRD